MKYGLRMVTILAASLLTGFVITKIGNKIFKNERNYAPLTVLLLVPLIFPPTFPLYMVFVSLLFGLVFGVLFFGGQGYEIVSATAMAWGFGALSFPRYFASSWVFPFPGSAGVTRFSANMPVYEHPLLFLKSHDPGFLNVLFGNSPGSPASALPLFLLILIVAVLILKVVDNRVAISFSLTTIFLVIFFGGSLSESLQSLLTGNFLITAFFIISQKQTSSRTTYGAIFSGILTGIAAFLIKTYSDYPDGALFAVLFFNVFSPIIDELVFTATYRKRGMQ